LTDWNRRFAAAERIQDFKQSARIRPLQTTTYTITADVADPNVKSFRTVSQNVTVTVMDDGKADIPCSSERYCFDPVDVISGYIRIVINKTCLKGNENMSMLIAYDGIKAGPLTTSYSAKGDVEQAAMKKLTMSRSLPSGFTNVIKRDVTPVFETGDLPASGQKKINLAISRALRSMK
jgi:hypothetical protein